jgi:ribosomal protein S2
MTQEEFERYEKGKQLIIDIQAHKEMIERIEEAINQAEDVQRCVMFVSCKQQEFRVPISKDTTAEVFHMARGKMEDELIELQHQFEEL